MDDNFTQLLQSYKNNYVAYELDKSSQNTKMYSNAKDKINAALSALKDRKLIIAEENKKSRSEIIELNKVIKQSRLSNKELKGEKDFLLNSDLGALEQDKNQYHIFKNMRIQLILEVCLIILILIFLYINDNVVQTIRGRFSKKTK